MRVTATEFLYRGPLEGSEFSTCWRRNPVHTFVWGIHTFVWAVRRPHFAGSLEWEQDCRALGLQPRWRELRERLVRLPGSLGWDAGGREQLQQWPGSASKEESCRDYGGCYLAR